MAFLKKKTEVKLGDVVIDPVTGMKGTAASMIVMLSGTVEILIQPLLGKGRGEDDKSLFIDHSRVKYFSEGKVEAVPLDDTSHIVLGDVYRDLVTGFEGTAVWKCMYLSGCTQVSLQPKMKAGEDKLPEDVIFDWKRLEHVSVGPVRAPSEKETTKSKRKHPGGPVRSSWRVA